MVSTFGGINTGASGLHVARMNLEVAGHNISNMNNKNFSRQVISSSASQIGSMGIWAGQHAQGDGVRINSINRVADQFFIDQENAAISYHGRQNTQLNHLHTIEKLYGEPSDSALASTLERFWDSWDSVAATPDDPAARTAVARRGEAVLTTINNIALSFNAEARNQEQVLRANVSKANSLIRSIAGINTQVSEGSLDKQLPPNDLMDQRDAFVRELSELAKVTVSFSETNEMYVNINGAGVVGGGGTYTELNVESTMPNTLDDRMQVKIMLGKSGSQVFLGDGALQATADIINTKLPEEQDKLNDVTFALMDQVNTLHKTGTDMDGNKGQDFFIYPGATVESFTDTDGRTRYKNKDTGKTLVSLSASIGVNKAIADNGRLVAAAGADEGDLGNAVARQIAELARASKGPDEVYRDQQTGLGVMARSQKNAVDQSELAAKQASDNRLEVSGVNQDEEVIKINQYIQAYQASARYLSAVDQMLDTLINGTGHVGR